MFDREAELERVKNGLNYPITLILGIRRSGKSSIVKVLMKEEDAMWIYIDLRKYEGKPYLNYKDLVQELERVLNSFPERLKNLFKGVKGVSVSGIELRLGWSKENKVDISNLFERLSEISEKEGKRVVIVFDESQELRKLRGYDLLYPLAYAYDNLTLRFIFTGSEIGMVYRFLKLDDAKSPLYGRAMTEVNVNPFNKDLAVEFLRRGFEEANVKVSEGELEEAYNNLGGIPGWLTYYGFYYLQFKDHKRALERTISTAVELIKEEFNNFLSNRKEARERYYTIMQVCKRGCRWSDVKRAIEAKEGISVDDKEVTNLIKNLVDTSFLMKEDEIYRPADVLMANAFQ